MAKEMQNPVAASYSKIIRKFNKGAGNHTWAHRYHRGDDARTDLMRLEGKFKVVATSVDTRDRTTTLRYYPKTEVYVLFDEFNDDSAVLSIKAKSLKTLVNYCSILNTPEVVEAP